MDLVSLLRTLSDHNQQVIGALIVIILATAGLLMARSALEKGETAGGPAPKADIDLGAIEAAFKRVLAAQGGAPVTAAAAPGGSSEADAAKIQELAREIDRLTTELAAKTDGPGFGGTASSSSGADAGAVAELKAKISELEGKLTEYEIIEDDIADLSRFKEENAELRGELDALKANVASGAVAPAATPTAAAPAAPAAAAPAAVTDAESATEEAEPVAAAAPTKVEDRPPAAADTAIDIDAVMAALEEETAAIMAAPAAAAPAAATAPVSAGAPAKPALNADADELAMKEFASSVDIQKPVNVESGSALNEAVAAASLADGSSVLDDSLDTEKMLSEVATLSTGEHADDAGLDGSIDTDKLVAEMGTLNPSAPKAAPAPAAAPEEPVLEDDLLAEFKESTDGGQG